MVGPITTWIALGVPAQIIYTLRSQSPLRCKKMCLGVTSIAVTEKSSSAIMTQKNVDQNLHII